MATFNQIVQDLKRAASKKNAKIAMWFFKTKKGQYGYGDKFLGVRGPQQREVAKKYYQQTSLVEAQKLLNSPLHEHRQTALFILVNKFSKSRPNEQKQIYQLYLKNTKRINNWDLVDCSAPHVVGAYLFDKNREILYRLAKSKNLWEKRIAILSTFYFIRHNDFKDTLAIAKILLTDPHDLIHKAVGWMLREVGNYHRPTEEKFLKQYGARLPRTALRYAIEKFPEKLRQYYLKTTR
jgi:3-methyladenine DNA glycosylase AlkD